LISSAIGDRVLAQVVSRARSAGARAPSARQLLTERRLEVFSLIVLGHTNVVISEKLFLTMNTVEIRRTLL
jgi:DNA-binding NarL/FixJ family response regulator